MFEYRLNRFVDPKRIVQANIYQKDNVIRVAIDLDVLDTNQKTIYSDEFKEVAAAKAYIQGIPIGKA